MLFNFICKEAKGIFYKKVEITITYLSKSQTLQPKICPSGRNIIPTTAEKNPIIIIKGTSGKIKTLAIGEIKLNRSKLTIIIGKVITWAPKVAENGSRKKFHRPGWPSYIHVPAPLEDFRRPGSAPPYG